MFTKKQTPLETALALTTLQETSQKLVVLRYVALIKSLTARAFRISILFHGSRIIITVGSLIVPALLSIQYTNGIIGGDDYSSNHLPSTQSVRIYWVTWFMSLLVTMCNGLLTLFKLDKRYYFINTTLEQLITEGWQFVELTAKYSGFYTPGMKPTHENQFVYFCHAVEKIRMRQVEEEYYKLTEIHATVAGGATEPPAGQTAAPPSASSQNQIVQSSSSVPNVNSFIPPTPLKGEVVKIPPEVVQFLQGQVSNPSSENAANTGGASKKEEGRNQKSGENGETG